MFYEIKVCYVSAPGLIQPSVRHLACDGLWLDQLGRSVRAGESRGQLCCDQSHYHYHCHCQCHVNSCPGLSE